jgi:hypothetical protein
MAARSIGESRYALPDIRPHLKANETEKLTKVPPI